MESSQISLIPVNRNHLEALIWVAVTIIIHGALIPFGVDLGDTGFFLTNQCELYQHHELIEGGYMTLLSDVVGGWWLGLINQPSWWWAKLGGVAIGAVNVGVVFCALSDMVPKKWLRFSILSALFLVNGPSILVSTYLINYLSFPCLLLSLVFLCSRKVVYAKSASEFRRCALFTGLFLGLAVLSRVPLLVLPMGCLSTLLVAWTHRFRNEKVVLGMVYILVGCLASVMLSAALLQVFGLLMPIIGSLRSTFCEASGVAWDTSHRLDKLVFLYLDRSWKACVGAGVWLAGLYSIARITRDKVTWLRWPLCLALALGIAFGRTKMPYEAMMRFREIFVVFVAVVCLYYAWAVKSRNVSLAIVYVVGVTLMLSLFIGSNTGLQTAYCGVVLCFTLSVIGMRRLSETSLDQPSLRFGNLVSSVHLEFAVSASTVFLINRFLFSAIYGDLEDLYPDKLPINAMRMNESYQSDSLAHLRSEPTFVVEVDRVLSELRRVCKGGDTTLVLTGLGGINYLSDTRPFIKNTLITGLSTNVALRLYEQACKSMNRPKALVWLNTMKRQDGLSMIKELTIRDFGLTNSFNSKYFQVFVTGSKVRVP